MKSVSIIMLFQDQKYEIFMIRVQLLNRQGIQVYRRAIYSLKIFPIPLIQQRRLRMGCPKQGKLN